MNYTEQLHAVQRAQLDWALEARAALADWRAAEPGPGNEPDEDPEPEGEG